MRATAALRPTDPSSAKLQPTPTSAEQFTLSGPSDLPDPQFHAYRKDLADIALASCVIASHYAEPVARLVIAPTHLRDSPSDEGSIIREVEANESFALLDDSLGWAWGYVGADRRVGYVESDKIGR